MRIAIVGSRGFADHRLIWRSVERLKAVHGDQLVIVSGGASGADAIAAGAAQNYDIAFKVWKPDWDKFGKSAGFKRNQQIVDDADMVIAFFADGEFSRGTANTVQLAAVAGKPCHVYHEGTWSKAAVPAAAKCGRCSGTGMYITGTVNGQPTGPGGRCFRCAGKGVLTDADNRRNYGYDNFAPLAGK